MALSRIGKKPVTIPDGVKVQVDGTKVRVQGPKGSQERTLVGVTVKQENGELVMEPALPGKNGKALHGLARALTQNMVTGVSTGFTRVLRISGVGYRADLKGNTLEMTLGYSHPVKYELPEGVTGAVEKQTKITLQGADKEQLGMVAAKIRSFRPPEPYKGKGIKYAEETVRRKVGKAGAK